MQSTDASASGIQRADAAFKERMLKNGCGIRQAKNACLTDAWLPTKKLLSFFLFDRSVVGFGEGR